jgi:hypothetical protein
MGNLLCILDEGLTRSKPCGINMPALGSPPARSREVYKGSFMLPAWGRMACRTAAQHLTRVDSHLGVAREET